MFLPFHWPMFMIILIILTSNCCRENVVLFLRCFLRRNASSCRSEWYVIAGSGWDSKTICCSRIIIYINHDLHRPVHHHDTHKAELSWRGVLRRGALELLMGRSAGCGSRTYFPAWDYDYKQSHEIVTLLIIMIACQDDLVVEHTSRPESCLAIRISLFEKEKDRKEWEWGR